MMTSELLKNVRLLDPVSETDRVADVLIAEGKIAAIAEEVTDYPGETEILNCQGLVLGPGLVDLYSHSGEPGFEERETLDSLMQAAAAGGFTRVALLPDTVPAIDNPASVRWLQEKGSVISDQGSDNSKLKTPNSKPPIQNPSPTPRLHTWAALTVGVQGQQMTELAELATTEIVGFADGQPINNLALLCRLLEYGRSLDKPIALWACDSNLAGNGVMREGQESIRFGLPGIPAIAETASLSSLLEIIEMMGTPVHLMRISTARSVELIRSAKSRGLPITASTTWMHLLLSSKALSSYDPSFRLAPPLGNESDRQALLKGLKEGVLDAIAIDHTPYTYEEKTVAFAEAPPGAIGLELALPLLWQTFVETGTWTALDLWHRLSTCPIECLHQNLAEIAPGQPAELTLFNPIQTWKVHRSSLKSLSRNTPWLGQEITGRVERIWVSGS